MPFMADATVKICRILTAVYKLEEAQILGETKQLRAAFKMPADLSGGAP